jgi:hypothetical protein
MEFAGEYLIAAPRQAVWDALNDPDILKQCIPGCNTLEMTSDTQMTATVTAKVGPVKATFKGAITLADIDPPNGYTISGQGKGGAAGFAKGGAKVSLEDADGGGTMLRYEVEAMVGGKLAQIGSRLIDATAKKMSREFFGAFAQIVAVEETPPPQAEPTAPSAPERKDFYGRRWKGYSPMTWISGGVLVTMILYAVYRTLTGP